jgi:hypothetical protein
VLQRNLQSPQATDRDPRTVEASPFTLLLLVETIMI